MLACGHDTAPASILPLDRARAQGARPPAPIAPADGAPRTDGPATATALADTPRDQHRRDELPPPQARLGRVSSRRPARAAAASARGARRPRCTAGPSATSPTTRTARPPATGFAATTCARSSSATRLARRAGEWPLEWQDVAGASDFVDARLPCPAGRLPGRVRGADRPLPRREPGRSRRGRPSSSTSTPSRSTADRR